ncbi:hypothetical protein ACS77_07945 [Pseudomonas syringae]|uniref:Uncharacterized protein n=1 Tax=Pseudomonas syringae TaxID=317 RepID=A0A0L1MIX0_PSESX|nr:hypothetical protein ACS77_07945 [Pseudomonas syringae]
MNVRPQFSCRFLRRIQSSSTQAIDINQETRESALPGTARAPILCGAISQAIEHKFDFVPFIDNTQ